MKGDFLAKLEKILNLKKKYNLMTKTQACFLQHYF